MKLLGLLMLIGIAPQSPPAELTTAVAGYWDCLMRGDKNAALQFVAAETRNVFIKRSEPLYRNWKLETATPVDNDRFDVTVSVRTVSETGFRELSVAESWILEGGSWKVVIPDFSQARRRLWQSAPARPKAGALEVLPEAVTIHFISSTQRANLLIRNGLDRPVQIVNLAYDADRFEIEDKPEVVPAGEIRRLVLRYAGAETRKNLTSRLDLTLRHEEQERSYTIPISYNVVSPGTRALFGLTAEKAEGLGRSDALTPVIKPPATSSRADSESSGGSREKRPEDKEF